MIRCQNLNFSHTATPLIHIANFSLQACDKVWVYGKSGSGKSTFLSLLAGLQKGYSGTIHLTDVNNQPFNATQSIVFYRSKISYVHQENHFVEHWTGYQNLEIFTSKKRNEIDSVTTKLNFEKDLLFKKVSAYSGGQKQLLSLFKVLLLEKDILLLDEPTSHLDDEKFSTFLHLLQNDFLQKTVLLVSHDKRFEQAKIKKIDFEEINQ